MAVYYEQYAQLNRLAQQQMNGMGSTIGAVEYCNSCLNPSPLCHCGRMLTTNATTITTITPGTTVTLPAGLTTGETILVSNGSGSISFESTRPLKFTNKKLLLLL